MNKEMSEYLIAKNDAEQELIIQTITFETDIVLISCINGVESMSFIVSIENLLRLFNSLEYMEKIERLAVNRNGIATDILNFWHKERLIDKDTKDE